MVHAHRFIVALLVLFLAACDRPPTLPKLNSHDVIVAFGDSLTTAPVPALTPPIQPCWRRSPAAP